MTTIRANCPSCGDVQLKASDLLVRVCSDDERGSYSFCCPECNQPVAKDASRRIVDLLISSGVRMQVWRLPAELQESHPHPSLTPDDLLDFHLMLQRDNLEEAVFSSIDPETGAMRASHGLTPNMPGAQDELSRIKEETLGQNFDRYA